MTNQPISNQVVAPSAPDEVKFMCRICSECDVSIHIYSDLGKLMNLEEKIRSSLRLELSEGSLYPNNVCMKCVGRVNLVHEIHELAAATQEKIATVFANLRNLTNGRVETQSLGNNPRITDVHSLNSNVTVLPPNQVAEINSVSNPSASVPSIQPVSIKRSSSVQPDDDGSPAKKKERRTVCSTCGQWFFKGELAAHTAHAHASVKLVFGCVNCSSNFATNEELTAHTEKCSISLDS